MSLLIRAGGHKRGLSVELVHSHSVVTINLSVHINNVNLIY